MRVAVVALGDLGRSPRIQLHARALAEEGHQVDLIGYGGERAWLIDDHAGVRIHTVSNDSPALSSPAQLARISLQLSVTLARLGRPDRILAQTPPAIPTLAIAALAALARGAPLIVDWHNLTHSLVALSRGARHPATAATRALEFATGRRAARHLCVSRRLASELAERDITAAVFADRPAAAFVAARGIAPGARRELLSRIGAGEMAERLLLVSPTSFSLDEDLDLLTAAAHELRPIVTRATLILVTGKGPRRAALEKAWSGWRDDPRLAIRTAWLEADDYPRLLAAADLGLSLHRSASSADFPMKILDMRGAGLPVLALDFGGLADGFDVQCDGWSFSSASELVTLVQGLASAPERIAARRALVAAREHETWETAWRREARPVICE